MADGRTELHRDDVGDDLVRGARRRLRFLAGGAVVAVTLLITVVTGVATGAFGDLGLPTDAEGRPRGLLAIGAAAAVLAAVAVVAYRRASAWTDDLLQAVELVKEGRFSQVDLVERGPRELRLLAATINDMAAGLAEDEDRRRRFLADITHELRNPLAVLQSEIEAQLDGVRPRDDRQLESLLDETRRLGSLLDDLHTLALAEAGRLSLRPEAVSLLPLVEAAVQRHAPRSDARGVDLLVATDRDLPDVWADPVRVHQIVDNLVVNAIRHTPPGGAVRIALDASSTRDGQDPPIVSCRVTDAGPGFPTDQLEHVFDRFTRGSDSRGSGLGLSIARDLVEAHGGGIAAENDPATGGGAVSFTLLAHRANGWSSQSG